MECLYIETQNTIFCQYKTPTPLTSFYHYASFSRIFQTPYLRSSSVERRNESNRIVSLHRIFCLSFQFPICVVYEHYNPRTHRRILNKHLLFVGHVIHAQLLNQLLDSELVVCEISHQHNLFLVSEVGFQTARELNFNLRFLYLRHILCFTI